MCRMYCIGSNSDAIDCQQVRMLFLPQECLRILCTDMPHHPHPSENPNNRPATPCWIVVRSLGRPYALLWFQQLFLLDFFKPSNYGPGQNMKGKTARRRRGRRRRCNARSSRRIEYARGSQGLVDLKIEWRFHGCRNE